MCSSLRESEFDLRSLPPCLLPSGRFFQVHVKNESGQCVIKGRQWRPPRRNSKLPFVIKFAAICPFSVSFKLLGGANIEIWLPPLD